MVKTEWDRLLLSFIPVAAVARFLVPRVIHPWKTLSIQVCNIPMTCVSVFKNEQLLLNWCVTVSKSARRICCWLSFLVKLQTDQQSVSVTQAASINDYWRAVLWPLPQLTASLQLTATTSVLLPHGINSMLLLAYLKSGSPVFYFHSAVYQNKTSIL